MLDKQPVMITAGGTGGHVYPGLAVARALMDKNIPVVWMGTHKGLEARIVPEAGIEMAWLEVSGIRGKGVGALLMSPFRLIKAMSQSYKILKKHRPAALLGMGGFVAGPGGLMASLMGIPVLIHEQNAVAGTTNKLLSRFATEIFEGFPGTFHAKREAIPTGNPVRTDIANIASPEERIKGHDGIFKVLVIGGSLGAKILNETVPRALCQLPKEAHIQVVHQAGETTLELAQKTYEAAGVEAHIVPFVEDMAGAYAWADIIICRSGALTVAEVAATGLAAIMVPYPHAIDDHQTENARYLADAGAAVVIPQDKLTYDVLAEVLEGLMRAPEELVAMSVRSRTLAKPEATAEVASIVADYAGYPFSADKAVQPQSATATVNTETTLEEQA
ncbi:MAG: UDP-N-acetylglucosamine--N-acetylmuramyl-(pentapeptide) pyrophosphoryl-undecaprenol N-acetylglucosamine transferase (EC [uncultured Thiotrichaceae bacterium]|uniref:UDP-N-acetylglucosamine--N-acetylmuramyl-(pentapeptide) pyrophosphoryl-undecaprenol N-acetylglucosamine transferase n=1 Tax=uncultured Thiotrichaceae bacterium TaxID=298394 RepID=A0A6S6TIP8_9GAMM|nr:MAG: UDP-N-acetylglucosamine--N-acetylmuramyl-(pentapeptide) pyrophosphoryl-undecaprenol N-acetylglucosamine transferase (EC [uncultured Thiotrichaceae bacterium]